MRANQLEQDFLLLIQSIHRIIEWLESLLDEKRMDLQPPSLKGQRVLSKEEYNCLSPESRHYLFVLEQQGILTPLMRERILHHAVLLGVKNMELPVIEGIIHILLGQSKAAIDLKFAKAMSSGNHRIH